jgi:hypothetical protein
MGISVVLPLFNKGSTVLRAAYSVLAQTYDNLELIIVNDGSTDDGPKLLGELIDPRVRIITQPNRGVSVARNVGVEQSRNEWVAFIDGDDEWEPNHLQVIEELRLRFPQCIAFGTAYQKMDSEGRVRKLRMPPAFLPDGYGIVERYFEWCVRYDHPIHSSAVAVKRAALEAIGGFPPGVRSGEDLLTWAKLACFGTLGFSSISTVLIHVPAQRSEIRAKTIRLPDDPDYVGPALLDLSLRHPGMAGIRAYVGDWHRIRATLYLEDDQIRSCASELAKALSTSAPTRKDALLFLGCLVPHVFRAKLIERFRRRPGAFH